MSTAESHDPKGVDRRKHTANYLLEPGLNLETLSREELVAMINNLYDQAQVGYLTLDENACVVHANLTLSEMVQRKRADLIGVEVTDLLPPGQQRAARAFLRDRGHPAAEWVFLVAGGGTFTAKVQHLSPPEYGMHRLAIRDITKRKRLEAEREARQAAERANELKTRFLAMVSHELRTPLTSIQGFAETLLSEDVVWGPDQQREFVRIIAEEAGNLGELIEQLLELSRLEAGQPPLVLKPVDITRFLEDITPELLERTPDHKLRVTVHKDVPMLSADEARLRQVFVNLVHNAVKFSPNGTQITIDIYPDDEAGIKAEVSDEGSGIPQEKEELIFEMFQKADMGTPTGAGLGLATCKRIVEAHGGRIWAANRPGKGLRVSFTLKAAL